MDESIFNSIKLMLGVVPDFTAFDQQILICINTALNAATQIGVGPTEGFRITGPDEKWSDFYGDDIRIDAVKSYIYIKTRMLFDPPQNSSLTQALKDEQAEIEWRLISDLEHPPE